MSNIFYTLQDEDGNLLPLAGIYKYNQYGLDDAEERAGKTDTIVVAVELVVKDEHNPPINP